MIRMDCVRCREAVDTDDPRTVWLLARIDPSTRLERPLSEEEHQAVQAMQADGVSVAELVDRGNLIGAMHACCAEDQGFDAEVDAEAVIG